jgi:hypothetical protein
MGMQIRSLGSVTAYRPTTGQPIEFMLNQASASGKLFAAKPRDEPSELAQQRSKTEAR